MARAGTFDQWVTPRISFHVMRMSTGTTGEFEKWITPRIYYEELTEVVEITMISSVLRGVGRGVLRGVG